MKLSNIGYELAEKLGMSLNEYLEQNGERFFEVEVKKAIQDVLSVSDMWDLIEFKIKDKELLVVLSAKHKLWINYYYFDGVKTLTYNECNENKQKEIKGSYEEIIKFIIEHSS